MSTYFRSKKKQSLGGSHVVELMAERKKYEKKEKCVEKKEILVRELRALGQYYRNDWSDFDGRTLRSELDFICNWFSDDKQTEEFTAFSDSLKEQENR